MLIEIVFDTSTQLIEEIVMKLNKEKTSVAFKLFLGLCVAVLVVVVWQGWVFFKAKKAMKEQFKYSVCLEMDKVIDRLSENFREISSAVRESAEKLKTVKYSELALEGLFKEQLEKYKNIPSFVCAFEPYAYDAKKRLFGMCWVGRDDDFKKVPIDYDYVIPSQEASIYTDWYTKTIKNGPGWVEPYWGTALQSYLLAYAEPFYAGDDKKTVGVVMAVYRLDDLKNSISQLKFGQSGYSFIISLEGAYAVHPVEDYYHKNKTIFDIAKDQNNKSLELLAHEIITKKEGVGSFTDTVTEQKYSVLFKTIPTTHLILCTVFVEHEVLK